MSLVVEGPSKATVSMKQEDYGITKIDYNILIAGKYKFFIRFDKINIPGSPFPIILEE